MRKALALFCSILLVFSFEFTVSAEAHGAISHGNREEKRIALTFDDGPHPRYTPKILSMLEKYDVKATFFMIGSNARLYPDIARKVLKAGHEIGNHTYSHVYISKCTNN